MGYSRRCTTWVCCFVPCSRISQKKKMACLRKNNGHRKAVTWRRLWFSDKATWGAEFYNYYNVSQGCPYGRFVISMRSKLMLNYIISLKYSLLLGGKELFHHVLKLALLLYADIVNMIVYFNRPFVRCVFHFRRHPIAPASPV